MLFIEILYFDFLKLKCHPHVNKERKKENDYRHRFYGGKEEGRREVVDEKKCNIITRFCASAIILTGYATYAGTHWKIFWTFFVYKFYTMTNEKKKTNMKTHEKAGDK